MQVLSSIPRTFAHCAVASMVSMLLMPAAHAQKPGATQQQLARQSCEGLRRAVTEDQKGAASGPLFLASYRLADNKQGPPLEPALAGAAFTYDNALAGIALLACGDTASAKRIGDAVVRAMERDPGMPDGRVRNAYRAGPMTEDKAALPGRWDAGKKQWIADAYQVSTATGNVAWAALLLLNLSEAVQTMLMAGDIEMGHARCLLSLDRAQQILIAHQIVQRRLSVRESEKLVTQTIAAAERSNSYGQAAAAAARRFNGLADRDVARLRERIADHLGTEVEIVSKPSGKGKLVIHFSNNDSFNGLLGRLQLTTALDEESV